MLSHNLSLVFADGLATHATVCAYPLQGLQSRGSNTGVRPQLDAFKLNVGDIVNLSI